ncbi:MAG: amidohydrolase family protein [Gemmatimonadaceae bacterium]
MISLIENGEVYAPEHRGRQSVLLLDGKIAKVGAVDRRAAEALGVECEVIDASDCIVCPGLIDPHEHILGGSGERGFGSMTPEIFLEEIVRFGFTTVVGCLGVDVTMKNMPALLAKAKALREDGIDAHAWTGGYHVPPASITPSVRDDILFMAEIIGVGEIAISDKRGTDPDGRQLAKVVHDAYVGGMLARKCGRTHFHVGERDGRLAPLRDLVENFTVEPGWLYATHVERDEPLMREAIELARAGAYVDIDVVEEDLPRWLRFYLDNDGDPGQLTVSSDAAIASPRTLYEQLRAAVREHHFPLELVLSLATANTARVLGLERQGTLDPGKEGDVLVLERGSLEVVHVRSRSGWLVRDGALAKRSGWLEGNKRAFHLEGSEAPAGDAAPATELAEAGR